MEMAAASSAVGHGRRRAGKGSSKCPARLWLIGVVAPAPNTARSGPEEAAQHVHRPLYITRDTVHVVAVLYLARNAAGRRAARLRCNRRFAGSGAGSHALTGTGFFAT